MNKTPYLLTCLLCAMLSAPSLAKDKPRSLIFSCESNDKMIEFMRSDRHYDLNITSLKDSSVVFTESCTKKNLHGNRYFRQAVTGNMLTCKNDDVRFTLFDYMNEENEVVKSTGIDIQQAEKKSTFYCNKNTISFIHEFVQ